MKVFYFDPKFVTPRNAGPTRAHAIARRLVERGHEVTMVGRDPRWLAVDPTKPPGFLGARERIDGIDVLWLRIPYEQRFAKGARMLSYAGYGVAATLAAAGLGRPDLVYASSSPLTAGIPAAVVSQLRRVPFVFELLDLWPAAPIALGHLNGRFEIAVAEWLERTLYAHADRIVVSSAAVHSTLLRRGFPAEQVLLVANFSETELFHPAAGNGDLRARNSLAGKFVALYAGAMGATNGVYQLADAAAVLRRRGEDRIVILAVGEGNQRQLLSERVRKEGLDNLVLLPPVPREELPALVAASDVTLTVFDPHPVLALNSPNKFFDSLAAGKPVVVNVDGWLRRLVEENSAGVYVPAGNAEALADRLVELSRDPGRVQTMGANARDLAEREFARDVLADRLVEHLEQLAERRGGGGAR
jgi:glycosyltransferase involved in cell wall biosynthesis